MTIVQIEYLIALNSHRNYSEAARSCNVTQPTLSMQLKKMEDEFDVPLIKKGISPVEFTKVGLEVVQKSMVVLEEFRNLNSIKKDKVGEKNISITIGVIPTVATYMVPKLTTVLKSELSHVSIKFIEMKTDTLINAVNEMDVDLGIMSGPYEGRLNEVHLFYEPILAYLESEEKDVKLNSLSNLSPWFLTSGNCFRMQMVRLCGRETTNINSGITYEGETLGTLVNMVDENGGYTLIPKYCTTFLKHTSKNLKSINGMNPVRSIVSISRKRAYQKEIITELNEKIQSMFTKEIESPTVVDWR